MAARSAVFPQAGELHERTPPVPASPAARMKPASRRRLLWVLALALVAVAATAILLLPPPGQGTSTAPPALSYVGVASCEECHAEESRRWRGSHHDLAMQRPGPASGARRLRRRAASRTAP